MTLATGSGPQPQDNISLGAIVMKRPPRVLVLIDWMPQDSDLLINSLRKCGLDCDYLGIDYPLSKRTSLKKIIFYWPRCLWVSIKAFRRRRDYDFVISWQQIMGMLLGFIKLITFSDTPDLFLLNATIVERKNPLLEGLRRRFISLSFKKIDRISFLSCGYMRFMQKRFHLSDEQLVHLKQPSTFATNPDYSGFKPDSYLYSVGLSYRDFPTLMAAAAKCSRPFVLATTDPYLKGLKIPDNVTVYRNLFGKAAEELMQRSAAVIFPLERTTSPAGETTLVNAMYYGKPVITTRTIITEEYIQDGQNGFLVPYHDADAIVQACDRLFANPDRAERIGKQARQTVLENHTMEVYTKKIFDIVSRHVQKAGTP